jgi:hypothetical protein
VSKNRKKTGVSAPETEKIKKYCQENNKDGINTKKIAIHVSCALIPCVAGSAGGIKV